MNVKNLVFSVVIALSVGFLFAVIGCSKSSNNGGSGTFSCTIDGAAFTAQPNQVGGSYIANYGELYVLGYNIQNKDTAGFQIEVPGIPPVNVPLYTDSNISIDVTYITGAKRYDAYQNHGRAVINLTSADTLNHKVAGTFSGVLYNDVMLTDSITVTHGVFSTPYTVQ